MTKTFKLIGYFLGTGGIAYLILSYLHWDIAWPVDVPGVERFALFWVWAILLLLHGLVRESKQEMEKW